MILSNNNGTFTPVAGGNATFIGTTAAFDAVKDTLPDNTVAYITDDGAGISDIIKNVYPIGSIYMSVVNSNPATLFPGTTWVRLEDRFLLGAGSSYSAGATGGEASHTLTIGEIPSHHHNFNWSGSHTHKRFANTNTDGWAYQISAGSSGEYAPVYPDPHDNATSIQSTTISINKDTENTGSNSAHNNMPPYLAVYMWKRTA